MGYKLHEMSIAELKKLENEVEACLNEKLKRAEAAREILEKAKELGLDATDLMHHFGGRRKRGWATK